MRPTISFAPLAALTALGLFAAPVGAQETRTRTYDGERATVTQTTTLDREAGTLDRDRTATHKESGKSVATTLDRQRTGTGSTVSRSRTGPEGRTRSLAGERLRSDNGSSFTGTATTRSGAQYGVFGSRSRDGAGNSQASQRLTGPDGTTLFARDRTTNRSRDEAGRLRTERSVSRTGTRPKRLRRSPR